MDIKIINGRNEKSCFGCTQLDVKDIWRGMFTASCKKTDGLLIPHEWTGKAVIINGIGEFCPGKDLPTQSKESIS